MDRDKSTEVQRTILYQNKSFEIVSIEWTEETKSAVHNHGWSQCQVLVQEGVFENALVAGAKTELRVLEVGQVLNTPVGAQHEMRCLSKTGKTLHVYTPQISAHLSEGRKFNPAIDAHLLSLLSLGESVRFERLSEILSMIQDNSISTNSPFFMNQLFSGIHPQALLAEEVIARTKTTMATQEASPIFSRIEREVVQQLCALLGWKAPHLDGVAVPGGSAANFMALQLAKHKHSPETKTRGLGGKTYRIFVSREAHYSFSKAAAALGFGTDAVVKIAVDINGRMETSKLKSAIELAKAAGHIPLMVCATAGTTVLGAFDPIQEIHQVCKEHEVWLHVDGAWGGPALFSKNTRSLVQHIEHADSVTFDAHKLFGASLTCSFFLTQHHGLLVESNDVSGAEYLFHDNSEEIDRGKLSWQCGRRADALSFWSIWKSLGTEGLGDFVDWLMVERDRSLEWIRKQSRLELIHEPVFLNVCVRVRAPHGANRKDWSKQVREQLKVKNLAMVNFATDQEGDFLRLIFAHPQITADHVFQILDHALEVS